MKEKIMEAILAQQPLKTVINLAAQWIGNPICLQNLAHQAITYSDDYPLDDMQDRLVNRRKTLSERYKQEWDWMDISIQSGQPFEKSWPNIRNSRLYCGCLYKKHAIAFLRLPETDIPLSQLDEYKITAAAQLMASALMLNGYPAENFRHPWHSFLWSTLNDPSGQSLEHLIIQPFMTEFTLYRLLWVDSTDHKILLEKDFAASQWWSLPMSDGTVILIDGEDDKAIASVQDFALRKAVLFGASDCFTDLRQLRSAFEQAKSASFYARHHQQAQGIATFDHYRLYHFVETAYAALPAARANTLDLQLLKKLRQSDLEKGTEYYTTLKAYLKCNKNVTATAQLLSLHRNTVFYRINRIKELFQIDFDDLLLLSTIYQQFIAEDLFSAP